MTHVSLRLIFTSLSRGDNLTSLCQRCSHLLAPQDNPQSDENYAKSAMKALFLTLALCAGWTTGGLISSESVTIPPTTCPNHGNPTLCCRSTKWTDLVVFYLGNYVAHALTTKITPGQNPFSAIVAIFAALLFPTSGIARSLRAISSGAIFAKTELQVAARAGALLMIVKAEYAYDDSSTFFNMTVLERY